MTHSQEIPPETYQAPMPALLNHTWPVAHAGMPDVPPYTIATGIYVEHMGPIPCKCWLFSQCNYLPR